MSKQPPRVIESGLDKLRPDTAAAFRLLIKQINDGFSQLAARIDNPLGLQGAGVPPIVSNFAVEGRQGGWLLRWTPLTSAECTGYSITKAQDVDMLQVDGRFRVSEPTSNSFFVFVGNAAVAAYFQIRALNGEQRGLPSAATLGTSISYAASPGAADSAPANPPEWTPPEPVSEELPSRR